MTILYCLDLEQNVKLDCVVNNYFRYTTCSVYLTAVSRTPGNDVKFHLLAVCITVKSLPRSTVRKRRKESFSFIIKQNRLNFLNHFSAQVFHVYFNG